MCYVELQVPQTGAKFKLELPYGNIIAQPLIGTDSPEWAEMQQVAADWMRQEMGRPSCPVTSRAGFALVKADYFQWLPQEALEWRQHVKQDVILHAAGGKIKLELPLGDMRVVEGRVSPAEEMRCAAIWLVDEGLKEQPPVQLRDSLLEVFHWALNAWRLREYLKLARA